MADIVAKVENRTTRRISLKSILRRACCRKALRRQYEGRWSFWYETMWSLMSPPRNASAVFKIFVLHPKKTFATISALFGHAEVSWRCPLLGEQRKTFAHGEFFRF